MAYYYPEGYFGPICDAPWSDDEIADRSRRAIPEVVTDIIDEWPDPNGDLFPPWGPFNVPGGPGHTLIGRNCKVRPDGTLYDCVNTYNDGEGDGDGDGPDLTDFGLTDQFFVPIFDAKTCKPFDPDINIRPFTFINADGTTTVKYKREKSTPVTFPVESAQWSEEGNEFGVWVNPAVCTLPGEDQSVTYMIDIPTTATYGFTFAADLNGAIYLNDSSTALINATGGIFKTGSQSTPYTATTTLNAGTLKLTVGMSNDWGTDNTWYVNPAGIGWRVYDGSDNTLATSLQCTAAGNTGQAGTNDWVRSGPPPNPEVPWGTFLDDYAIYSPPLPAGDVVDPRIKVKQQAITYITISSEIAASIKVEGDNQANFKWELPNGNIVHNGPVDYGNNTVGQSDQIINLGLLPVGDHKLTFDITNDVRGEPYEWSKNPGGWYIKICQGGVCAGDNTIDWVRSGPHPAWPQFMDDYAVYPSNVLTLEGVNHTANYLATCPSAGTYTLECRADNYAAFTWDGASVGSIGQNTSPFTSSFSSSTTFNITGVAVGDHTLGVTVYNGTGNSSWTNNPGGVAFVLRDASNNVIMTSLDLNNAGNGNLLWHTRLASGYEYYVP